MDDMSCRLFFTQPTDDTQRLYEALRAVFLDDCRQKDVAERFGFSFDAFRQQVHQFRLSCGSGELPPFSLHARAGVPLSPRQAQDGQRHPPSPTAAPATWHRGSALAAAALVYSCSCPCSPRSGLTTSSARPAIPVRP